MRPPDDPELASWVDKANEDLSAVEILRAQAPGLDSVIGFHCQQAAEKLLKAVFVALDRRPPRTHDLTALVAELIPLVPDLAGLSDIAAFLGGFAVLPRYPSIPDPDKDPAEVSRAAAEGARGIDGAVRNVLGLPPRP